MNLETMEEKIHDVQEEATKTTDETTEPSEYKVPIASRGDLQWGRRFFHAGIGTFVACTYWVLLTHQRAIYLLGFGACILYLLEQIRINYPNTSSKIKLINRYFLRGEEYLKESSAMPYAIGMLLTVVSFPQPIAIVAILILALGDPMAAVVGIAFGKHHIVKNKSIEGSIAFFLVAFLSCFTVFYLILPDGFSGKILGASFVCALFSMAFEMIPLKLDDNLTIPLFTSVILWILCAFSGIPV